MNENRITGTFMTLMASFFFFFFCALVFLFLTVSSSVFGVYGERKLKASDIF